jgi:hypothetical protein
MLNEMVINRHDLVVVLQGHGLSPFDSCDPIPKQHIYECQKLQRSESNLMTDSQNSDQPSAREDEDDYDLLTFGEARARLEHEVRKLATLVGALEGDPVADPAELAAARRRLEVLQGAAARNARQPINDENFTRFFGYEGTARRNTK